MAQTVWKDMLFNLIPLVTDSELLRRPLNLQKSSAQVLLESGQPYKSGMARHHCLHCTLCFFFCQHGTRMDLVPGKVLASVL